MSSRVLLTLLALLTGLAAQATPAEARLSSARNEQMSAVAALAGETRKSIPEGLAVLPTGARQGRLAVEPVASMRRDQAVMPTVLMGIDRARE